jgi:hypothetical protein
LNVNELLDARDAINAQLRDKAREELRCVAVLYTEIYGDPDGIYQMGEDLCREVAQLKDHHMGWTKLVTHLVKISG